MPADASSQHGQEPGAGHPGDTAALLLAARGGDRQAISTLLVRDLAWVQRTVHRRLGGVVREIADTNDVVQELFLRVLRSGPRLQVDDGLQFRRLMARIVQCTLVSMARRAQASRRHAGAEIEWDTRLGGTPLLSDAVAPAPESAAAQSEEREHLRLALELIDPADREVLQMRDYEGLTFVEIAARVESTEDAVRMRYRRAVGRLRGAVERLRVGQVDALLGELDPD
ncbi:MAG: RNA polymerase sigma factor [Planctomycetota bacterium]